MDRRKFFITSALAGTALGMTTSCNRSGTVSTGSQTVLSEDIPAKVMRAMLSMQRASWEHGVASQAVLEAGDHEMTWLMAKEAVLRQRDDGRLAVVYTDNGVTDPGAAGEAVLRAYEMTGDKDLGEGAEKMLQWLLEKAPRSSEGILYHTMNSPEIWSDAMYMAPPFMAAAGRHEEALRQIEGFRKILWDSEKKLFSHRWHDGEKRFINRRFWGGGNGWAAACYARVIKALPEERNDQRTKLEMYHRDLLDGCLPHMRSDGLFHDFVDEPDTFVETNLGQMLAYSIFRGVKGGWLDSKYMSPAIKMREAAWLKTDDHGYVSGACGAPSFDRPGRSVEAQAFFLLMEVAFREAQS